MVSSCAAVAWCAASASALSLVAPPRAAPAAPAVAPASPSHFVASAPYVLPEGSLAALAGSGFCVVEGWASEEDVAAFRGDAMKQRAEGRFVTSKVGSRLPFVDHLHPLAAATCPSHLCTYAGA